MNHPHALINLRQHGMDLVLHFCQQFLVLVQCFIISVGQRLCVSAICVSNFLAETPQKQNCCPSVTWSPQFPTRIACKKAPGSLCRVSDLLASVLLLAISQCYKDVVLVTPNFGISLFFQELHLFPHRLRQCQEHEIHMGDIWVTDFVTDFAKRAHSTMRITYSAHTLSNVPQSFHERT